MSDVNVIYGTDNVTFGADNVTFGWGLRVDNTCFTADSDTLRADMTSYPTYPYTCVSGLGIRYPTTFKAGEEYTIALSRHSYPYSITVSYNNTVLFNSVVSDKYTITFTPKEDNGDIIIEHQQIASLMNTGKRRKELIKPYPGKPLSIGYTEGHGWSSTYTTEPELLFRIGDSMFAIVDDKVVEYTGDNAEASWISFVLNDATSVVKIIQTIVAHANVAPEYVSIYCNEDDSFTNLVSDDFEEREGVWYAAVLNNRMTPGMEGYDALIRGDKLKGKTFNVFMQFNDPSFRLDFVQLRTIISGGQTIN